MQKSGIIIAILAFVILMGSLVAIMFRPQTSLDPMVGQSAPEISLETLSRDSARLSSEGDTLINFWATWCTPCIAEHPVLMQLADDGLNVVGVAYRDKPEKILAYLSKAGDPFSTLYLDPKGEAMIAFGTRGVPESFLIGADGKVKARISGALEPQVLNRELRPALKR